MNESDAEDRRLIALAADVERVRAVAEVRPDEYGPRLAEALRAYGSQLLERDLWEEAAPVLEEAAAIHRRLAATRRDECCPDLIASLHELIEALQAMDSPEQELAAWRELAELYGRCPECSRADGHSDLADILWECGVLCEELGRQDEALAWCVKAVDHYRFLAMVDPSRYVASFVTYVASLRRLFPPTDQSPELLDRGQEVVDQCRGLVATDPSRHPEAFAAAQVVFANVLGRAGRRREALAATADAVHRYRELAVAQPDVPCSALVGALLALCVRLTTEPFGEADAVAAGADALEAYRHLVETSTGTTPSPGLAAVLVDICTSLRAGARRSEATTLTSFRLERYRRLRDGRPVTQFDCLRAFLHRRLDQARAWTRPRRTRASMSLVLDAYSRLADVTDTDHQVLCATLLNVLGTALRGVWRRDEAVAAGGAAVTLYRRLGETRPGSFEARLAIALSDLAYSLIAAGRDHAALEAAQEAVQITHALASAGGAQCIPDLVCSLHAKARVLAGLGRHEDAIAALNEAALRLEPLIDRSPAEFAGSFTSLRWSYLRAKMHVRHRTPDGVFERIAGKLAGPQAHRR